MQFGAFVLDKYGAPKLSKLTEFNVPEMAEPPNYLGSFVLNSLLIMPHEDPEGRFILMFGRRVEHAIREYRKGRDLLLSYVAGLPQTNNHFLRALQAATHFEQCVGSICQAAALLTGLINRIPNTPPPEPDNREARLKLIWNRAKHFDDDIEKRKNNTTEDITAPVWLTNDGIECTRATVTFDELHAVLLELLSGLRFYAEELPAKYQERQRAEAAQKL